MQQQQACQSTRSYESQSMCASCTLHTQSTPDLQLHGRYEPPFVAICFASSTSLTDAASKRHGRSEFLPSRCSRLLPTCIESLTTSLLRHHTNRPHRAFWRWCRRRPSIHPLLHPWPFCFHGCYELCCFFFRQYAVSPTQRSTHCVIRCCHRLRGLRFQ